MPMRLLKTAREFVTRANFRVGFRDVDVGSKYNDGSAIRRDVIISVLGRPTAERVLR